MGCWNKTCGLSNLHIRVGNPTYVFVLEQSVDPHDRCNSTAMWSPLLLPFEAECDDYGGGENVSGFVDLVINGIRDSLVEMEQGENEFHDIPVKAADFDVNKFFEAVHEGRLYTVSFMGGNRSVDFVMFRKDVVDYILANYEIEKYVGEGLGMYGPCGGSPCYIKYRFADVLADIPEFLDKVEFTLKELEGVDLSRTARMMMRGLTELFEYKHPNKVGWYMRNDGYRYSSLVHVHQEIIEFVQRGEREKAEKLLSAHLLAIFIDEFMHDVRKMWGPGGHEGDQNQEPAGYRVLCNAINSALDVEKAEWDAENGGNE